MMMIPCICEYEQARTSGFKGFVESSGMFLSFFSVLLLLHLYTPLFSRYARPWGMHPDAAAAQASKRGSGNEKLITFIGGAVSAVFEVKCSKL